MSGWRGRAVPGLLSLMTLAGCSPLSTAPPPPSTLQIPAAYRSGGEGSASVPASAAEAIFWRAFGDPLLAELVQTALARNGDVRIAISRLQEFQARVRLADSARQPTLNASLAPGRARAIGAFGTPVEATSLAGNLQSSYELDLFGKLATTTAAARAELGAQQALAAATALSVAASTASGYLNLRGLDAQLALARATLVSRERSLALARRQFEVGYSSRLDWAQAQAEYHVTAAVLPQLERSITQQENALAVLTGASVGSAGAVIARGASLGQLAAPAIAAGLPSSLLRRRPDIVQAELAVVALDASLAAARAQMLPSVRLNAGTGLQAYSLTQLLNAPTLLWSVGGSVLAPLLDGGRLQAQADIAAAARDRAILGYESVVRSAFADTDNALGAVHRLDAQLAETVQRQQAAAEVLRVAHKRYANGYASYLEELDAQRNGFAADQAVLQLRAAVLVARVDLFRALGGGWILSTQDGAQ
ncbi:efflux transporter outer membrane subunit [Massilia sp. DWR3-1-1]|uniref:efflux transporter outer membrane subunit n=1 Tax=Massilia sp. DWR3-1-1 TaxID=2804559 RepID=UPI003CF88573